MLNMSDSDYIHCIYEESFKANGFSAESVLFTKKKQEIRFKELISQFDLKNNSIMEFGCGFGDINRILKEKYNNSYEYSGIDLVEDFINVGRKEYGSSKIKFECGDFLNGIFRENFDYVIGSGIFNIKLKDMDNYKFIEHSICKAFELCNKALAFNFLTERVNFKDDDLYYINPEKVLEIVYRYSKRVVLKNNYMPFDYTVIVYKDDSYDEKAIYHQYE